MSKVLLMVLLIALLLPCVSALGVAPAIEEVTYEAGKTVSGNLMIVNTEQVERRLLVVAEGELADYITLSQNIIDMTAADGTATISYTLTLPDKVKEPGEHKTKISIIDMPMEGDTGVSAKVAVNAIILVKVPYPNKYAEADLHIDAKGPGETSIFNIPVFNLGKHTLNKVDAQVEIFGPTWEKVGEAFSESIAIDPMGRKKLVAAWNADVPRGTYHVKATVTYDGHRIEIEKNLEIGSLYLDIKRILVEDFKLGEVAEFNIELLNTWNKVLNNVFAEMSVSDKSGKEFTNFKTVAIDIEPNQYGTLQGYWYTKDVAPGLYDLKLAVHYANKVTEKIFEIEVQPDSISARDARFTTGRAVSEDDSQFVQVGMLIIIVFILIIVNVISIVYFSRKLGKKK